MSEYPEEGAPGDVEAGGTDDYKPRYTAGSETLGEAVRRRRELLGVTQEDLAERFGGPSVTSLWTIERAQSDSYRAKTLFSLDTALAWPKGASMTLLTGKMDRLDTNTFGTGWNFDFLTRDTWGVAFREDPELTSWELDTLVDNLIKIVPASVAERYDIPVLSASWAEMEIPQRDAGEPTAVDRPAEPGSQQLDAPRDVTEADEQIRQVKQEYLELLASYPLQGQASDYANIGKIFAIMQEMDEFELKELGEIATSMAEIVGTLKKETREDRKRVNQRELAETWRLRELRMVAVVDSDRHLAKLRELRDRGKR